MNKKSKYYTLMFVPEDNGKTFSLRVHKWILKTLLIFLIVFLSGLLMLLFKSGEIAAKLQLLRLVTVENDRLNVENKQLRELKSKIDTLNMLSFYLENLVIPSKLSEKLKIKPLSIPSPSILEEIKTPYNNNSYDEISTQPTNLNERLSSIPNIPPVNGWITRPFCATPDSYSDIHAALDFAASTGSPIKATAPGIVEDIRNDKYFGLSVTINHDFGFITKYGHCSQILVTKKERVSRGQTIALVGNTGRSTAPHLHYEIVKDGKNVDPSEYLLVHQN
jgi:murein DD-endopeptidase MepM/ murein hydrolase activator NlpD